MMAATIPVISPLDGRILNTYAITGQEEITQKMAAA
jgi:hypothetical protein